MNESKVAKPLFKKWSNFTHLIFRVIQSTFLSNHFKESIGVVNWLFGLSVKKVPFRRTIKSRLECAEQKQLGLKILNTIIMHLKVGQLVRQAFPNIELCKVTNSDRKRLRCYKVSFFLFNKYCKVQYKWHKLCHITFD